MTDVKYVPLGVGFSYSLANLFSSLEKTHLYKPKQILCFSILSVFVNTRKWISSCDFHVCFVSLQPKPSFICLVAYEVFVSSK